MSFKKVGIRSDLGCRKIGIRFGYTFSKNWYKERECFWRLGGVLQTNIWSSAPPPRALHQRISPVLSRQLFKRHYQVRNSDTDLRISLMNATIGQKISENILISYYTSSEQPWTWAQASALLNVNYKSHVSFSRFWFVIMKSFHVSLPSIPRQVLEYWEANLIEEVFWSFLVMWSHLVTPFAWNYRKLASLLTLRSRVDRVGTQTINLQQIGSRACYRWAIPAPRISNF